MKKFIKSNTKLISQHISTQFAFALLGLLLFTVAMRDDVFLFFAALFSVAFYLFLIYTAAWDSGAKQRIKDTGASGAKNADRKNALKGSIVLMLLINAHNILLVLAYSICKVIYLTSTATFEGTAVTIGNLSHVILKFIWGMFTGFEMLLFPDPNQGLTERVFELPPMNTSAFFYIAVLILIIAAGTAGFMLGYEEKFGFMTKPKE